MEISRKFKIPIEINRNAKGLKLIHFSDLDHLTRKRGIL